MTREFKVGDEVFCIYSGIGKVIEVTQDDTYPIDVDLCFSFTADGRRFRNDKRPALFHLDEALKLFPMWLEEVEEIESQIKYAMYYPLGNHIINSVFDCRELCERAIAEFATGFYIAVEIHIPTKHKIIREKQQ